MPKTYAHGVGHKKNVFNCTKGPGSLSSTTSSVQLISKNKGDFILPRRYRQEDNECFNIDSARVNEGSINEEYHSQQAGEQKSQGESGVLEAFEETIDASMGWRLPLKTKFHQTLVKE